MPSERTSSSGRRAARSTVPPAGASAPPVRGGSCTALLPALTRRSGASPAADAKASCCSLRPIASESELDPYPVVRARVVAHAVHEKPDPASTARATIHADLAVPVDDRDAGGQVGLRQAGEARDLPTSDDGTLARLPCSSRFVPVSPFRLSLLTAPTDRSSTSLTIVKLPAAALAPPPAIAAVVSLSPTRVSSPAPPRNVSRPAYTSRSTTSRSPPIRSAPRRQAAISLSSA